jgi:tRNA A64-2'-O-ribosylphosphate transferase
MLAAARGGLLLVDATRSATKRVPDALAKTVPIWAAVLNHAVAQHRASSGARAADDAAWRAGVALPPWVAESEAAAIDARVPGWAAELAAVGADVAGLSDALARPLRALWLSQASPLWGLPDPAALPFTPLLCVSASAPLSGYGHRHASNQAGDDAAASSCAAAAPPAERESRAYAYIPGAGDDEETWARGLTPALFWQHRAALLAAGSGDAAATVDALVAAQPPAAAAALPAPQQQQHAAVQRFCAARAPLSAAATGLHDLPPAGTRMFAPVGAAAAGAPLAAGGVRWLGDAALGCASVASLNQGAALWRTAGALLVCGDAGGEAAAAPLAAALAPPPGALLCVRVTRAKLDKASLVEALPAATAFASAHLAAGRAVLVVCPDGCERAPAVAVALLAACFREVAAAAGGGAGAAASPPRVRFVGAAAGGDASAPPCADMSKLALRRWLAFVSAHHPDARPTRGLLKQVYCFLRGGDDAPHADD